MKIWLSKNAEVFVSEQLLTQIKIGIASGGLPPGERLPSTREMARRFNFYSNTVGAVYQKLAVQGLLKFKKGSGFYVCRVENKKSGENVELDNLIREFLATASDCGFNNAQIRDRL